MSLRRPASGRRIGGGMLRVDAARAIAKLRDYQLSEPTAWILEGIRAAVASGATRINLQGDSNDVWLSWHGEPWPSESLATLLDNLVSPASAKEGQKLRLLGTAVNSALGLRPSYIDLYRIADGVAHKVRYKASLLDEQEESSVELARPEIESVEMPKRAGDAAMFIHFRRRFGLEPIRNLLQGQPPEMRIARAACRDLALPIVIGDEELGAHTNTRDLLRVEIGHNVSGFLALIDANQAPEQGHALMTIAEHGVHIVSYPLDLQTSGLPPAPPLRFFIDSDRMPTNASRSEVRRSSHPINTAEKQLPTLHKALCAKIVEELAPEAGTDPRRRSQIELATLTLLAAFVAGANWSRQARNLQGAFRPLTDLPLLKNAIGEQRSLSTFWDESALYTGEKALPKDMRPWFEKVLWCPAGSSSALLAPGAVDASAFKLRMRSARRELKARRRFEEHKKRPASFARLPDHWVHAPLGSALANSSVPASALHLEGEVFLCPELTNATIRVLLDGREIEEIQLDLCPLPFRAIVEAPHLRPVRSYRAVARDPDYKEVESYVLRAAIRCVEVLCRDGAEGYSRKRAASATELASLTRAALEAAAMLGVSAKSSSTLANFDAWHLADGQLANLAMLRQHSAIGRISKPEQRSNAPAKRPTLVLARRQVELMRGLLGTRTALVNYAQSSLRLKRATARSLAATLCNQRRGIVALAITEEHTSGAIAWGLPGTNLWISHRSQQLQTYASERLSSGATVCVDDDRVVPTKKWMGVQDDAGLANRDFREWTSALVKAFAMALIGRPPDNFVSNATLSLDHTAGLSFVATLLRAEDLPALLDETYEALRAAPIFTVLGGKQVSANDLAESFPVTIDYLGHAPSAPTDLDEWEPLIASKDVAKLACKLSGSGRREGSKKLSRMIHEADRRVKESRHRQKPVLSFESQLAQSPSVIDFRVANANGLVSIGHTASTNYVDVVVLIEGRHFQHIREESLLPIAAVVEVAMTQTNPSFQALRSKFVKMLVASIRAKAPDLILAKLSEDPSALSKDWILRKFCKAWLEQTQPTRESILKVRALAHFTDQRGQALPLTEALSGSKIRVSTHVAQPWLEARDDVKTSGWDAPILTVAEDSLADLGPLLSALCDGATLTDVSDALRTHQTARLVEYGLLQAPTVPVQAPLKRGLTELGHEALGEIGFYNAAMSEVRVFDQGREFSREPLAVRPSVLLAIEEASLLQLRGEKWNIERALKRQDELSGEVERLTIRLLAALLAAETPLPGWLREQLAHALCKGEIAAEEIRGLGEVKLFLSTAGRDLCWNDLVDQSAKLGSVWHTRQDDRRLPLDPARVAITLPEESRVNLTTELNFADGEKELVLDQIARRNQEATPIESLDLSVSQSHASLTSIEISDKGGLQGIVAPLLPQFAGRRGVFAHRNMLRIGTAHDPCTWPTIAIIDDPALSPDRTWSAPVMDGNWTLALQAIVKASDHALVKAIPPVEGALTSHWVGRSVEATEPDYRKRGISVRGRLWLGASTEPGRIKVQLPQKEEDYAPSCHLAQGQRFSLPVHGTLICHAPIAAVLSRVLQEIVDIVYPRLLRQAARLKNADPDLRSAQLAIGIASAYIAPNETKKLKLSCFAPNPLGASEFRELVESSQLLEVADGMEPDKASALTFCRDESELSSAIERLFGPRLRRQAEPEYDSIDIVINDGGVALEEIVAAPEVEVHVLDRVARELYERLNLLEVDVGYVGVEVDKNRKTPILAYTDKLSLAGKNPRLLALQATHNPKTPTFEAALDLLVAHALTLLNTGRAQVTDATETRAILRILRHHVAAS